MTSNGVISLKQIKETANSIDPRDYGYNYVGIRIQEGTHGAQVGQEINHCSNIWDDGDMTDEKLSGISAINVPWDQMYRTSIFDETSGYFGDTVLILGSDQMDYGEDPDEIVMINAVVIDIRKA